MRRQLYVHYTTPSRSFHTMRGREKNKILTSHLLLLLTDVRPSLRPEASDSFADENENPAGHSTSSQRPQLEGPNVPLLRNHKPRPLVKRAANSANYADFTEHEIAVSSGHVPIFFYLYVSTSPISYCVHRLSLLDI